MLNNIFNHMHSMGARSSSPYRLISKMPNVDKANEEGLKKEKMDKAQAICRRLDTIKTNHMLQLNSAVLDVLNTHLPHRPMEITKYKEYPLASPSAMGRSPIFQKFKSEHGRVMREYNDVFTKMCEIDAAKQNILKADTKEKMPTIENEFRANFDASTYFTHPAGLDGAIGVTQRVRDIANEIDRRFMTMPNVINMLI